MTLYYRTMHQPSAPSGEWYWLESSLFTPPRTCLTPHSGWTPCDINVTYTSLKSAFNGLQFCRWQYGSIFIRLAVIASETLEISRNSKRSPREFDLTAVQSNSRSSILVLMDCPYVTSYQSVIATLAYLLPFSRYSSLNIDKKAQLTLANPRDVNACKNCSNSTCFVSFHRIPFPQISKFRPRPI